MAIVSQLLMRKAGGVCPKCAGSLLPDYYEGRKCLSCAWYPREVVALEYRQCEREGCALEFPVEPGQGRSGRRYCSPDCGRRAWAARHLAQG